MDAADRNTEGRLRSTIGFDIFVRDIMTRDVLSVRKYESILTAANILSERGISGLPVVDKEGKVIGIITQADVLSMVGMRREHTFRDILKHVLGDPLPEHKIGDIVADIMVSPALTIKPHMNIAEAAQIMDERKIRRLPVVDDEDRLIGILSRADILRAVIKKLQ